MSLEYMCYLTGYGWATFRCSTGRSSCSGFQVMFAATHLPKGKSRHTVYYRLLRLSMYGGRCRDHAVLPEVFLPKVLAHMVAKTNKAGTKDQTPTD